LHGIFQAIANWVFRLGGPGLFLVGIVDSSFLFMPLANDFLLIALAATHHERMFYYALMAALGSTIGCAITDTISRKAGETVQEKKPSRYVQLVRNQVKKNAGWTIAITALLPPPFPFTPFVAAAAGAGYPRKKLLSLAGAMRMVRFTAEGLLAIVYGKWILSVAQSPAVKGVIIGLTVIAVIGIAVAVYRWVASARSGRHSKTK
jgi:membrane protein YqaA with SNARE-associated domain